MFKLILAQFHSSTQVQVYNVNNFHEIVNHPSFSHARNTVIYHYGFTQTPVTQSVMEVIQAYLSFGNVNFILVNYESVTTNTLPVNDRKTLENNSQKNYQNLFIERVLNR